MRIRKGFKLHDIGSECIVVAEGDAMIDYTSIITLNESGALVWKGIVDQDFDVDTIAEILLENYDIDEDTATADAEEFLESLLEADLIVESVK